MLLFVGAASAALAAGGPDALVPFSDVAGAATTVGVGFVLDFSGSGAPVTGCVQVPPTDTGYQALSAFVAQENLAQPGFASDGSGLLCSINGIPAAPACGQAITGGYQYWSYWYMTDGSGNWTYANRGASAEVGSAANGQDVEGWRFQNPGPDNPSAPKPSAGPDYASLCHAVAPPTAVTTPPTTIPTPVTTPVSPVVSPAPKGTGLGGATTSTTVAPGGSSGSASPTSSTTGPVGAGTAGSTTTTASPSSTSQSLRAADTADHEGSGGGAVPAIIGALVVLALAAAAVIGWRRRARTP